MNSAKLAGVIRRHLFASVTAGLTALTLLAVATTGTAFAASPAGTPIGNQATATYKDASATSYTVTSNAVTTIVQQVASFTLTAPGTRNASPGGQATFPHVLTNTGNGADAFPLTLVNLGGDNFDLTGLAIYPDADGNGVPDNLTPTVTVLEDQFTPATYNDPALTRRVRGALDRWLGADNVKTIDPEMGGEDFSEFGRTTDKVPVCLIRVGAVDPAKAAESQRTGVALPSLHSSRFAPVPEPTIKTGITAVTAAALELLAKK